VPYLSSIERIGLQKGLEQGRQEGSVEEGQVMVLEAVSIRFGVVPEDVVGAVHAITAQETLRTLLRQAIAVPDLVAFREALRLAKSS